MLKKVVMWYLHQQYKKYGRSVFYIRGTGSDYPKYLLYTEKESVYERMDEF